MGHYTCGMTDWLMPAGLGIALQYAMDLKNSICFWQQLPAGLKAGRCCCYNSETAQRLVAAQVHDHAYCVKPDGADQRQQHTKELQHPAWLED